MEKHCIGVILAGGRSSRMGQADKALCRLAKKTLIETAIARAAPQVDELIVNTNSEQPIYRELGLPVVNDCVAGQLGPLAGILSALEWVAQQRPRCRWLASFSVDTPFVPLDMVDKLLASAEREQALLATVRSNQRAHPVIGLWSLQLRDDLREQLLQHNMRKVDRWTARHRVAIVDFDSNPVDPFFNVNTPEDLNAARAISSV